MTYKEMEEIQLDIDIFEDLATGYIAGKTGNILANSDNNEEIFERIFNEIGFDMNKEAIFALVDNYLDEDWDYE